MSDALAVGHAIGECVGYYLDAHSAENHPGKLTEALCSEPAEWFRSYANLGKRLKEFKDKYREVRKIIADSVCDGELKLVSNDDVKDYFLADSDLKPIWEQHNSDVTACFKLLKSYDAYKSKAKNGNLLEFASAYLYKVLIPYAEKTFGPLYFNDFKTEVVDVVDDVPVSEETESDIKFTVEHCRLIYMYFVDEDTDESREEPWYLLDGETVEQAVERFKNTFKGIYHEPDGVSYSNLIEFDRKVRVWAD